MITLISVSVIIKRMGMADLDGRFFLRVGGHVGVHEAREESRGGGGSGSFEEREINGSRS